MISHRLNKPFFLLIAVTIFILFTGFQLFGDTIVLKDETVLVGKILTKTKKSIIFRNSYGVFRINKKNIVEMFVTTDYEKDIEIHKQLGKEVDEEIIKKDFLAGMGEGQAEEAEIKGEEEAEEMAEPAASKKWKGGRLIFSGMYLYTVGEVKDVLPYGYGGIASYDQGLDYFFSKRHFWMPGLHLEGGYLFYKNDVTEIKGPTWSGGPIWLLPIGGRKYGNIFVAGTSGMSHISIRHGPLKEKSDTATAWGIMGYEYSISNVIFQMHGRYMYIFDKDVDIHSIGGLLGVGLKLW